jgi:hypothetical protein
MNSMSKSSDGWTTVQRSGGYRRWGDSGAEAAAAAAPREMPAAFGGGGGGSRMAARREEESRRAWEERQRERAAKAEAEKKANDRDITNMKAFPALGGGTPAPPKKKVGAAPLNFRDMARETAARTALEEAEAAAVAKHRALEAARRTYVSAGAGAAQPRLYRHGSYDDGPVDHDFPDEEGYYPPDGEEAGYYPPDDGAGEDDDGAAGEYNAELAVTRRRGDKSDW